MTYYQEFEGIVLSKRKHREKDGLVKIFMKDYGKAMFFVKNLMNPNHPLRVASMPLTSAVFLGRINADGLHFLHDSKQLVQYRKLQEDIVLHAYATYLIHLVDAAIEDRVVSPSLFELVQSSLEALQTQPYPELIVHLFEVKALPYFGIFPDWQRCTVCHSLVQPFDFSIKLQGMICQNHWEIDPHRLCISAKAAYVASLLAQLPSPKQLGNVVVQKDTLAELRRLMDAVYQEYVGIHLKSKKFIDQMHAWQVTLSNRSSNE